MKTAAEVLKIIHSEDLFPNDLDKAKEIYHSLSKEWHPDTNKTPKADCVFAHINNLYHDVVQKIENKTWCEPNTYRIKLKNGSDLVSKYLSKPNFELGDCYISNTKVVYVLKEKPFNSFFSFPQFKKFKFANAEMEREMQKYLPSFEYSVETEEGFPCLIFSKKQELLSLRDIFSYYKKSLDPKHVAWIMNSLYNITCYLSYVGLVHCEITLDTVFISPQDHSSCLIGGWWYSVSSADRLKYISARTNSFLPSSVRESKVASSRVDLELVKALGRELLGDVWGTKLSKLNVPEPMAHWLRNASGDNAIEEYRKWNNILIGSFGPRKFVPMDITAEMLY